MSKSSKKPKSGAQKNEKPKTKKRRPPSYKKPKKRPPPKNQAEFAALQKEWYDYLAAKGFKDLEWVDHSTGLGQSSDYLKLPTSYIANRYDPAVEEYYRKCRIYLEHAHFESKLMRFVFELHTEGMSYRDIAAAVKRNKQRFRKTVSIFWISQHLNELLEVVEAWHTIHPLGVNSPDTDFYIAEIPIKSRKPESE